MSGDTTRCLLVGLGSMGRGLIRFLEQKPWFEAVGVVDVREEARAEAQTALHLPDEATSADLAEALAATQPDAAIINTPSELHFEQTKAALEAGVHVLVAKPITHDFAQAAELVAAAKSAGRTLSVGQQMRYNRHYTAVRTFVASGALGNVEAAWLLNSKPRPNAAALAEMAHPALLDNAVHHFDSLLAVFPGREPEWIACDGFRPSWSPYAGPCMVNALIRLSGGLHVGYHGGFSSRAPMYEFRIEGAAGALRCRGLHMSNDLMSYEFAEALGQFEPAEIDKDVPVNNPWVRFLDDWHDYARGAKADAPFSGRSNLRVMAMVCAAVESVDTGRPVDIAGNPTYAAAFKHGGSE
jgi:predicted dehydrogenase